MSNERPGARLARTTTRRPVSNHICEPRERHAGFGHGVCFCLTVERKTTVSQTTQELKIELHKSLALLSTLRDEVRVTLHLAGMDAKDKWAKLEPEPRESRTRRARRIGCFSHRRRRGGQEPQDLSRLAALGDGAFEGNVGRRRTCPTTPRTTRRAPRDRVPWFRCRGLPRHPRPHRTDPVQSRSSPSICAPPPITLRTASGRAFPPSYGVKRAAPGSPTRAPRRDRLAEALAHALVSRACRAHHGRPARVGRSEDMVRDGLPRLVFGRSRILQPRVRPFRSAAALLRRARKRGRLPEGRRRSRGPDGRGGPSLPAGLLPPGDRRFGGAARLLSVQRHQADARGTGPGSARRVAPCSLAEAGPTRLASRLGSALRPHSGVPARQQRPREPAGGPGHHLAALRGATPVSASCRRWRSASAAGACFGPWGSHPAFATSTRATRPLLP